jgi:SAM-dependent methyltransferase
MNDREQFAPEFERRVKDYYRHHEEYDWTSATAELRGVETVFHRARLAAVAKLVGEHGRPPFLDVGCGTALMTRSLPGGTVAVDLNPRNLDKAARYAPHARFLLADAEGSIPLRDNSFQTVLCTEMLEHLLHPELALREIRRVLRPGGLLIGSVPSRSWIWKLRALSSASDHFKDEPYHRHFTRNGVDALLAPHFPRRWIRGRYLRTNWYFVCEKESATGGNE